MAIKFTKADLERMPALRKLFGAKKPKKRKASAAISPDAFTRFGLPTPEREFRFHRKRRWRLDWAWPLAKVALEVEGGVWTKGRHTRPKGFLKDIEKYNAAAALGWRVIRCTPSQLASGEIMATLKEALR